MASPSTPTPQPRRRWPLALGGCVVLAVCLAAGLAAAGWAVLRRPPRGAAEPAIEYIVDASPRMALQAQDGDRTRLSVARSVLAEIVRPADPQVAAGLRVFGAGSQPEPCQDTRLVVPLAEANQAQIAGELAGLEASTAAEAALAVAILSAIRDLAQTQGPHTLVAITGGADTCSPEAGPLIAAEAEQAGVDLHLFVIGYQLSPAEAEAIRGLVLASGGDYYDAANEAELRRLLEAIQNGVDQNVDQPREAVRVVATQLAQARGTPTVPPGLTATAGAATGVPTPAAVTDEAPYAAQTACDHPYLPLRPGARWTYVSAAGTQTAQVTGVTGGPSTATATMTRDGAEPLTWQCDDSGLWANTIPHEAQVFGLDPQINGWEWLSSAGAWLLPPGQLAPGAQWAFNLTFQDNDAMGTGGQIGEVESVQALAAVGTEPLAFNGGVVEALRIDSTFEVTAMGSAGPPGSVTYWYARGIGLIRLEFARGAQTALFELQSYTVP